MTSKPGMIPVTAAPMIDPGKGRISVSLPQGMTIAEIVDYVLPDRAVAREYIRVALVTKRGSQVVPPAVWHLARPHSGVHVVIRVIPGKDALRSILQIVVTVAAIALGQYWAGALFAAGTTGFAVTSAAITLGVTPIGSLQFSNIFPGKIP